MEPCSGEEWGLNPVGMGSGDRTVRGGELGIEPCCGGEGMKRTLYRDGKNG